MHGKVPGQSFLQILFFFSLCYQRNGKVRGEVFSSLVSVRAYSAKFLIGSETLVRKRAKCFMHMYGNCKHLTLAVRFLKIGCQTRTFLKYLCQPSLRAQMRGSWVPPKNSKTLQSRGLRKCGLFGIEDIFFCNISPLILILHSFVSVPGVRARLKLARPVFLFFCISTTPKEL